MKAKLFALAIGCSLILFSPNLRAGDTNAPPQQAAATVTLPDAARAAVAKAFPKATMGKVTLGIHSNDYHKVYMTEAGLEFHFCVTDLGVILDVNIPVAVTELPKVVTDAVLAAGGNGAVVVSAIKREFRGSRQTPVFDSPKVVHYQLRVVKDHTSGMMTVQPDGTVVQPLTLK
jgi:hypothetical protein